MAGDDNKPLVMIILVVMTATDGTTRRTTGSGIHWKLDSIMDSKPLDRHPSQRSSPSVNVAVINNALMNKLPIKGIKISQFKFYEIHLLTR